MAAATEAGWLAASAVVRFLVYALTLLAAGGGLFIATVLHGSTVSAALRRYVLLCAAGAAAALIMSLGIEGGLLTLGPWTALFDPAIWCLAAAGTTGASVAAVPARAGCNRRRALAAGDDAPKAEAVDLAAFDIGLPRLSHTQ